MLAYFFEALDYFISDLSKLYEIPAHVARLLLEIRGVDSFLNPGAGSSVRGIIYPPWFE